MKNKACYVINFYLGDRRKIIDEVKDDRLYFLKKQIAHLFNYKHNLSKIIFNFNIREEDYPYVNEIFKTTPKYIQDTEVEINFRENYGMSYGAWSDAFIKNKDKYDYYIFNEDDYFFIEDKWDEYLINKFNSLENCGYLCMVVREGQEWCDYKKHAGHSTGISSFEALNKVYSKYGELPHSKSGDYRTNEQQGQVNQSNSFIEVGYEIYDIRDDYRVEFTMTEGDYDIWRFFWWNEKFLIKPAILLNTDYCVFWESFDDEFSNKKI
jgi:hypothetical protein